MAKKPKASPPRKPQVTFQVSDNLKVIYEFASDGAGLNTTRLCAAGFLWMLEHAEQRQAALARLQWLETAENAPKTQRQCEEYVKRFAHVSSGDKAGWVPDAALGIDHRAKAAAKAGLAAADAQLRPEQTQEQIDRAQDEDHAQELKKLLRASGQPEED